MIPSPTFFLLLQKMNKREQNEQKGKVPYVHFNKKLRTKQKKQKNYQNFDTKFKETLTLH
jgi:hypothetical protein